jgi:hypothetical protein
MYFRWLCLDLKRFGVDPRCNLVDMTYHTWHGYFHANIYALIHLYFEYGNAYLRYDTVIPCLLLIGLQLMSSFFQYPHGKLFHLSPLLDSYFGGNYVTKYFVATADVHLSSII